MTTKIKEKAKTKTKKKPKRYGPYPDSIYMDRVRIYMPPGWKECVEARAEELGITQSQYVSRLIALDLAKEKETAR